MLHTFSKSFKDGFRDLAFFESKLKGRLQEPTGRLETPLGETPRLKLRTKGTKQRTPWALAPRLL